jgi:hypothetical protein
LFLGTREEEGENDHEVWGGLGMDLDWLGIRFPFLTAATDFLDTPNPASSMTCFPLAIVDNVMEVLITTMVSIDFSVITF